MEIKSQKDVLNRQSAEFDLEIHRQMLLRLAQNGGPSVSEYSELTISINQAADAVVRGTIPADNLRDLWGGLGDAVTSTKTMQGFVWLKPHGYAGDFEIIPPNLPTLDFSRPSVGKVG